MSPLKLKAQRCWDVRMPPKRAHMVAGKLLPTVPGVGRAKKRRVVVELYSMEATTHDEEPPPRLLERTDDRLVQDLVGELNHSDIVVVRFLKPRCAWGFSKQDDDDEEEEDDEDDEDMEGFVEFRKYELDEIGNAKVQDKEFRATFGRAQNTEIWGFQFPTHAVADGFAQQLQKLAHAQTEHKVQRLETFAASYTSTTTVQLLVEIVSASNLPIADVRQTDPFVAVFWGTEQIHQTTSIANTRNPIWTVDTGCLFVFEGHEDFLKASGLVFFVVDHDAFGKHDVIGKVVLFQEELLSLHGQRVEYNLQVLGSYKTKSLLTPTLALRVRPATLHDVEFCRQWRRIQSSQRTAVYLDESWVAPPASSRVPLWKREVKHGKEGTLYRVKPGPDPSRPEADTKWMTEERIEQEHLKHSKRWIEAGSGKLGYLCFEILHCDGLPNKDNFGTTDAFCSIVYEDAIVNTDVIQDETDPRWMPWCQRAFCFHMQHPSPQILVAVLDYDANQRVDQHDAIGRVSINLTNLRADTVYVLTYNLFKSVLDTDRTPKGTLTVRLRIEYKNYRNAILASLRPPPFNCINVAKRNHFKATFYVCHGDESLHKLSMDALKTYGEELSSYTNLMYTILDAVKVVFLWRGHHAVNIFGLKFKLPLHSVVAFVMGITLIENINLLPSYGLFAVAWIMLATNEQRQRHPSPWHQTATFRQLWYSFLFGTLPPEKITDHENEAAIRKYEAELEEALKERQEAKEMANQTHQKLTEFLVNEEDDDEDDEVNTGATKLGGGPSINPLKPILVPIQQALGLICKILRVVTSITVWDESLYAFILTNSCIFGGLALIWVPWDIVLRWTARVVLWAALGPHMKLVDMFYVRKLEDKGENEAKKFQRLADAKLSTFAASKRAIMEKKEELLKVSALKRYMFGKYVTRVPMFKEYRFRDVPLAESTATPYVANEGNRVVIAEKRHGQLLIGSMVPRWADAEDEEQVPRK